jgi:hypothetical protein
MLNVYKYYLDTVSLPHYDELNDSLQLLTRLNSHIDGTDNDPVDAEDIDKEYSPRKLAPVLHIISQSPKLAAFYATYIIESRWPEVEPVIAKNAEGALEYAIRIIDGRFPEAEPTIMKDPYPAKQYAAVILAKDPKWPHKNGRWPEAEPYIKTYAYIAYRYAAEIIRGRFIEAEPYIMKKPTVAVNYATTILVGDPNWPHKGWPEAEQYIKNDEYYWGIYKDYFKVE